MKYIKTFKDLGRGDAHIAGGKGASLGEMTNTSIPVPPGFVVLSDAFEYFIREIDLVSEIDATLKKVNHKEMESVERASEVIRDLIENAQMPKDLEKEILVGYKDLDAEWVAVRSSATAEDGVEHAWAGQLDSFLNTKKEDVIKNVQRCFASLFTPRAIFYRFEKRLHNTHISVAVVAQKMVQSEKSGIAFSVHPVTEDYNQMIIEGSWGLGEAIVSGQVTPDSYVVEKDSGNIIDVNVAEKNRGLFKSKSGANEWEDIDNKKANEQCLKGSEILELGNLIKKIEKHYGFPCDIEWAFEDKKFYIVQSRPITTLKPKENNLVKDPLVLMGAWDVPPIELFHWFDSFASLHMQKIVGTFLRTFSYSRDGLHYQCFFERDLEELRKKFESNATEKDKSKYLNLIYDDFDKHIIHLEKYLGLIENIDPKSSTNKELGDIVIKLASIWTTTTMQVWYALFLDIWYPDQHTYSELKAVAAKARDHTGHIHARSNIIERKFYEEISKRVSIRLELVYYLFPEEISEMLIHSKDYKKIAEDRNEFCVTESTESIYKIHSGKEARDLFDTYNPPALGTEPQSTLAGIPASMGKVSGVVRVIKLNKEFDSFLEGEILVSPQTTIHYVPIMAKASAILTEFGGLTSHAAIVSRELKKPCIVGIKNLLVSLKDGDLVEVDAEKGIVTILKRA